MSYDGRQHPETRDGVKTYGPCRWGLRWQTIEHTRRRRVWSNKLGFHTSDVRWAKTNLA